MEPIGIIIRRFVNLSQTVPVCVPASFLLAIGLVHEYRMNLFFCAHDDDDDDNALQVLRQLMDVRFCNEKNNR